MEKLESQEHIKDQIEQIRKIRDQLEGSKRQSEEYAKSYQKSLLKYIQRFDSEMSSTLNMDTSTRQRKVREKEDIQQQAKKIENNIGLLQELQKEQQKEIDSVNLYLKTLNSQIKGREQGQGLAVPEDSKYQIYIEVKKHGLKLQSVPQEKQYDNMKNTVVYETLVDVFVGPKNFNLTYRDYSDGTNILFIELLSEDNRAIFSVINYIPLIIPESIIKQLKEESGIKCDETLEEFYYEVLQ